MKIEKGMIFQSPTNNRKIKILEASDCYVRYQDLKYMTVFTVGRKMFEHCQLKEVKEA